MQTKLHWKETQSSVCKLVVIDLIPNYIPSFGTADSGMSMYVTDGPDRWITYPGTPPTTGLLVECTHPMSLILFSPFYAGEAENKLLSTTLQVPTTYMASGVYHPRVSFYSFYIYPPSRNRV